MKIMTSLQMTLLCFLAAQSVEAARAPRKPVRPKPPTAPAAPVETKVSTKEDYATVYNSTHTCDLSQIDGGSLRTSELKCLYSPGIPSDRGEIQLDNGNLSWTFYRDGKVSGENNQQIRIFSPNTSGNRGLCKMRVVYTSMTCNDDMAPCTTVGYFGVNNSTRQLEMIFPAAVLQFCRNSDPNLVEQILVLEPAPPKPPVRVRGPYDVEKW